MDFISGETVGIILFFIGLFGLMTKKNILKTIMSISILQSGIYLFFIADDLPNNSIPPIGETLEKPVADPVPQALMITAIVIGLGITAIGLTMFIHYKKRYGISFWSRNRSEERSDQ
ncbi:sodium:proton antiporter [Lacticigenium naphthae]|uniref:sodium:proton antiporter n=1 Tax=Lacticigenium naphthae TaxID=515351 RepID=UPI000425E1CE|nr:cation:proton antiporter subunit C [Lacticigenium naphthae]